MSNHSIIASGYNLTHVTCRVREEESKTIGTEHLMQLSLVRLLDHVWRYLPMKLNTAQCLLPSEETCMVHYLGGFLAVKAFMSS